MTWTYGGDPENSDRDAVRLLIGDTDTNDQQLTDAEVDYFLSKSSSVYRAAISAVRALIAKYARKVTKAVGDLRLSLSDRLGAYEALLEQLQADRGAAALPHAGGISVDRKDDVEEDTDRVTPSFERDQFSYPGTESGVDDDIYEDTT